jgi:hypothetical protein
MPPKAADQGSIPFSECFIGEAGRKSGFYFDRSPDRSLLPPEVATVRFWSGESACFGEIAIGGMWLFMIE